MLDYCDLVGFDTMICVLAAYGAGVNCALASSLTCVMAFVLVVISFRLFVGGVVVCCT